MLDFFEGNFQLGNLFTELVRWVFVFLAIYILLRAIKSLLKSKNPAEVWAYIHLTTYKTDEDGNPAGVEEASVPLTHWENVIGRAGSCDISVEDPTLSRNHGILMRNTRGKWIYRDLGSRNGPYINDEDVSHYQHI